MPETNLEFVTAEIIKIGHKIVMLESLQKHMPQHAPKFEEMIQRFNQQIDDLIGAIT